MSPSLSLAICGVPPEVAFEITFAAGQHYAETGQGYVLGYGGVGFEEDLAVGDDELRTWVHGPEEGVDFAFFDDDGDAVMVEDIAYHLNLWQYHPAFRGFAVDGCDEEDDIAIADEVAHQGRGMPCLVGYGIAHEADEGVHTLMTAA